jgi:hypothetical protein
LLPQDRGSALRWINAAGAMAESLLGAAARRPVGVT